ncbi:hypothetical protein FH972_026627 [Carpinus fangiana]|uniref:Uncharacterized protein n=1 Tax=Carpinus fangiana TaxID=176857 RepID=A0A5N6L4K4_9ROSI|nr:hypothetical protein FH972_026627 [Carpinus fangiana]
MTDIRTGKCRARVQLMTGAGVYLATDDVLRKPKWSLVCGGAASDDDGLQRTAGIQSRFRYPAVFEKLPSLRALREQAFICYLIQCPYVTHSSIPSLLLLGGVLDISESKLQG